MEIWQLWIILMACMEFVSRMIFVSCISLIIWRPKRFFFNHARRAFFYPSLDMKPFTKFPFWFIIIPLHAAWLWTWAWPRFSSPPTLFLLKITFLSWIRTSERVFRNFSLSHSPFCLSLSLLYKTDGYNFSKSIIFLGFRFLEILICFFDCWLIE
jgi:hypothetical protein